MPPRLRAIVEKALEKSPRDRYQSMRDMVVDLRRLTRQGIEAIAPAGPAPTRSWAWAAAIAVVAAAALVVGFTALGRFGGRRPANIESRSIKSIAVLPLRNLSRDPNQQVLRRRHDRGVDDQPCADQRLARDRPNVRDALSRNAQDHSGDSPRAQRRRGCRGRGATFGRPSGHHGSIDRRRQRSPPLGEELRKRALGDMLALQNEVAESIAHEIQVKLTPRNRTF